MVSIICTQLWRHLVSEVIINEAVICTRVNIKHGCGNRINRVSNLKKRLFFT